MGDYYYLHVRDDKCPQRKDKRIQDNKTAENRKLESENRKRKLKSQKPLEKVSDIEAEDTDLFLDEIKWIMGDYIFKFTIN